jgi:class 3 adenylate cyclase
VAREQRKLAAVLAADVVGYSRLMGRDESGTLARLSSGADQAVACRPLLILLNMIALAIVWRS